MFDVWLGNIELTTFFLIFSVAVLLPIQLLLCFKVKSKLVRLLPVIILSALIIAFIVLSATAQGWDNLGYLFLAIFAGMMLLMDGIGWGIWAMIKAAKERTSHHMDQENQP